MYTCNLAMIDFDIPTYIPRPTYVTRLEPLVGKDVIKVLVGQRRVGKSYLLYHVVDMIRKRDPACPVLYVNKGAGRVRRHPNPLRPPRSDDEATRFGSARLHPDRRGTGDRQLVARAAQPGAEKRFDIYCTGSNAEMLSGDIATLLAGRAVEVPVRGLSYGES